MTRADGNLFVLTNSSPPIPNNQFRPRGPSEQQVKKSGLDAIKLVHLQPI